MNFSRLTKELDSRRIYWILLGGIVLLVVMVHLFYLIYDGRSFVDHDMYFTNSFFNMYYLMDGDLSLSSLTHNIIGQNPIYPFINSMLTAIATIIPPNRTLFKLYSLGFYLLLIFGGYLIGNLLANEKVGILCAFILATLPIYDNFSRKFDFQFHTAAVTLLAYYYTLKIFKGAWTIRDSVILGLLLGIGFSMHPTALITSIPIMLFIPLYVLTAGKHDAGRWYKLLAIIGAGCLPLLIFLPFLFYNYLIKATEYQHLNELFNLSYKYVLWYNNDLLKTHAVALGQFYYPLLPAAILSTIFSLWASESRHFYQVFLIWSIGIIYAAMMLTYVFGLFPIDFMLFYSLAVVFLVAEIYSLLVKGIHYRPSRYLSIPLVIAIIIGGLWTKEQAFHVIPPSEYRINPASFDTELRSMMLTKDFGQEIRRIFQHNKIENRFVLETVKIDMSDKFKEESLNDYYHLLRNLGILCGHRIEKPDSKNELLPLYRIYTVNCLKPSRTHLLKSAIKEIYERSVDDPPLWQTIIVKNSYRSSTPASEDQLLFVFQKIH